MGVWIEIKKLEMVYDGMRSLPAWECGLKYDCQERNLSCSPVTPCVGVWIEILS